MCGAQFGSSQCASGCGSHDVLSAGVLAGHLPRCEGDASRLGAGLRIISATGLPVFRAESGPGASGARGAGCGHAAVGSRSSGIVLSGIGAEFPATGASNLFLEAAEPGVTGLLQVLAYSPSFRVKPRV